MKDTRWADVLMSADSAARHFNYAVRMFDRAGLGEGDEDSYGREMALMHAMQSGYTSFEAALLRAMKLIGERPPVGDEWHKQLVDRAAQDLPDSRPAIIPTEMVPLTRRLRSFRHWAAHGYDDPFQPEDAVRAVEAARRIVPLIRPTFEAFIGAMDV